MYRLKNIILVTGVPATLGSLFPSPSPPPAVVETSGQSTALKSTGEQGEQGEQQPQQQQQSQNHKKYVDKYVPAEFRHFVGKNNGNKDSKDSGDSAAADSVKDFQDTSINLIGKQENLLQEVQALQAKLDDDDSSVSSATSDQQEAQSQGAVEQSEPAKQSEAKNAGTQVKAQKKEHNSKQYIQMQQYAGGGGQSGGQSGDWQKYMKQYAGKYAGKYASGGSGGSQSGNYQQYMKKYAGQSGDYMNGGSGSQGGNYQQYMTKYAGGSQGGSQGGSNYKQYYEKYMKQYGSGSQGGSQSGNYQQYMEKYTGGNQSGSQSGDYSQYMQGGGYQQYMEKYTGGSQSGSQSGDYQQYMQGGGNYSQYLMLYAKGHQGGEYMKKYAGSGGSGYAHYYDKYIKRYKHNSDVQVIHSAKDAKNESELNSWRSSQQEQVKEYVPDSYSKYANDNIERQYKNRLYELKHNVSQNASSEDAVQSVINLNILSGLVGGGGKKSEKSKGDSNQNSLAELSADVNQEKKNMDVEHKTKMRDMTTDQLQEAAEASIQKAEILGKSLKTAADDKDAIELIAKKPAKKVKEQFAARSQEIDGTVSNIKSQVAAGADFKSQVREATRKVKEFRDDELRALDRAHHQATEAARHAARGAQSEVRREARQVWKYADEISRRNETLQDQTNKLENRAEEASDHAESNSEELARRTQDHLEDNLSKARDEVRRAARQHFSTLNEFMKQFEALQGSAKSKEVTGKQVQAFLAQRPGTQPSTTVFFSYVAALALAVAGIVLYVKRYYQRKAVNLQYTMLG